MEKELVEYLNGQRNSVSACVHMSRENLNNSEKIYIGLPDAKNTLYAFYNSKTQHVRCEKIQDASGFAFMPVPSTGTGGKEAYVMLMLTEFEKLPNMSLEAKGMIMSLINCLEWNTGRIIRQRDKLSITKEMLIGMLKIKPWTVRKALKELSGFKILRYDRKQKAYFMSHKFIKKGEERK
jgi:hypothetical protein